MSFSSNLKTELSKINNLKNKDEVFAEFLGYLVTNNITQKGKLLKFSTENEYNINRFAKLLWNLQIQDYKIEIVGKTYNITVKENVENIVREKLEEYGACKIGEFLNTENLKKAFVRGNFLGAGSINNPQNKYHLEIIFSKKEFAVTTLEMLKEFEINAKLLNSTIYFKDGEEISNFLALIGANSAVLKFEQIRVMREMKNNVNRLVNCETANLNKTINASVKQIETIKKLKKTGKFNNLPEELKEIANLREQNPNATSEELGNMLQKSISKSSVSHRFKKIEEYLQ